MIKYQFQGIGCLGIAQKGWNDFVLPLSETGHLRLLLGTVLIIS